MKNTTPEAISTVETTPVTNAHELVDAIRNITTIMEETPEMELDPENRLIQLLVDGPGFIDKYLVSQAVRIVEEANEDRKGSDNLLIMRAQFYSETAFYALSQHYPAQSIIISTQYEPLEIPGSTLIKFKPYTVEDLEKLFSHREDQYPLAEWIFNCTLGHPEATDKLIEHTLNCKVTLVNNYDPERLWYQTVHSMLSSFDYIRLVPFRSPTKEELIAFCRLLRQNSFSEDTLSFKEEYENAVLNTFLRRGIIRTINSSNEKKIYVPNQYIKHFANELLRFLRKYPSLK